MAENSMKKVWEVFCRNSTEPPTMAFPGFVVNYSWRKIFTVQWSNWKVAIVVLFSAGLVISWISKLIQTPLQSVVMEGNAHPELPSACASGEITNLLFMYRRPWRGNTSVTKDDGKADTWPPPGCTDLLTAVLIIAQGRVFTLVRLCLKVRICKLHGAEGGNWFWPSYPNTIQGNCSNTRSGCLWTHHFTSTVSHATNRETAAAPFYSASMCFSCCCILSSFPSLLLG